MIYSNYLLMIGFTRKQYTYLFIFYLLFSYYVVIKIRSCISIPSHLVEPSSQVKGEEGEEATVLGGDWRAKQSQDFDFLIHSSISIIKS